MSIIPIMKKTIVVFFSLYSKDFGSNSIIDKYVIIPDTNNNIIPIILFDIILFRNICAISAPNGSESADISTILKALYLLFVP